MLPMVGTAEEARHIVNSMKYTAGKRGVALQLGTTAIARARWPTSCGRQRAHDPSSA